MVHLIFDGNADEAIAFYAATFDDAVIERVERYGAYERGLRGSVRHATLWLGGRRVSCADALPGTAVEEFSRTISLVIDCADELELERLGAALVRDGEPLGGPRRDHRGRRSVWVRDRFGVVWWLTAAVPAQACETESVPFAELTNAAPDGARPVTDPG